MGAKSREAIQDIALHAMDKVNRHSKGMRDGRPPKLEDQLKEAARKGSLTPEQRMKELEPHEWERQFKSYLESPEVTRRHGMFSKRFLIWLFSRKRADMEVHHLKGTAFNELIPEIKDLVVEHMNL